MGRLGGPELIIILVIVILLFGAKKLPDLARAVGQSIKEFNKAKDEARSVAETDKPKVEETKPKGDEPKV